MKKQSYTIEKSNVGNFYYCPTYPTKFTTKTISGRICKIAGHKKDVRIKVEAKGSNIECKNDRAAIKKAKQHYPELKNFKGHFKFKIKYNGKSCGVYKYGNRKNKLKVFKKLKIFNELSKYFPSTRIAVPRRLKNSALKFWGAAYFKWHLKSFKKEWSDKYNNFILIDKGERTWN
jgi:hypothetical protein